MTRGGPRAGSGPPPAENSRARDRAARAAAGKSLVIDDGRWLTLPREGRSGNPPAWPLTKASAREREVWRQLWKLPQALGWERNFAMFAVALYVRSLVRAEAGDSVASMVNLVRLLGDGLGLSAQGLRMLQWRIGTVSAAPVAAAGPVAKPTAAAGSPRDRLRVVPPRGDAG